MDLENELNRLSRSLQEQLEDESSDGDDDGSSDIEVIEMSTDAPRDALPVAPPGPPGSAPKNKLRSLICPICLETPEIVAVAPCGHAYCHECVFTTLTAMKDATKVNGVCSICRKKVRYDQVLYMEFKTKPKTPLPSAAH